MPESAGQDLIDAYYERDEVPDDERLRPGALFLAPVLEFEQRPWFAHLDRIDPRHERPATFVMRKAGSNWDPFDHLPIKESGLEVESDEGLAVFKVKKRPVVVFSLSPGDWNLVSGRTADEAYLCIPSYSLDRYDAEHVAAVQCFKYPTLFHLPADPELRRREGMLRFDRSQVMLRAQLEPVQPAQKLTEDALLLLQAWYRYWSTGLTEDWVLQYQAQQLARLAAST